MIKTISGLSISSLTISNLTGAALFGAVFAASALSGVTTAAASPAEDQIISGYCDSHPVTDECNSWRLHHADWGEDQYQAFYNTHVGTDEFSTPEAKEAFSRTNTDIVPGAEGNAAAAPVDPSQTNSNAESGAGQPAAAPATDNSGGVPNEVIGDSPNHVADCQASFKSYNPATDTYVGLDGETRKCKL